MTLPIKRILVQYEGQVRSIPKSMWEGNELEANIVGEARVVVRRGSLVANIPDDVPFGTFCICVNVASIKTPGTPASKSAPKTELPEDG
ncbi:MAG: hypothetical protein EOO73_05270 [Myxococcales bacterium]|nr:MAG: hypothetical protein EOO73_05270 [Myxococcales bacterium]